MSDTNKSGYAIRADLLSMAISILESRASREFENEHLLAENDKKYKEQPVNPYETEEVLDVAEKLYGFVQKK